MPGSIDFRCNEFVFDPLKLSETYEPLLPFFREAELKHGRTAMLAVVGWITADLVRFPGETYSFSNVPSSHDAHNILLTGPMVFLLMAVGLFDLTATGPGISATFKGERDPGGTLYLLCGIETKSNFHYRLRMVPRQAQGRSKVQGCCQ